MKKRVLSFFFAFLLAALLPSAAFADAIVFPDDSWDVDYYVYVTTPDGGLNMREGPGVDYTLIMTIPDYELLHVFVEKSNGWGYVQYGYNYGWVYLGQTSIDLFNLGTAADYYTYVISPDGHLNMRIGPSSDCDLILGIPTGTQIHITREYSGWGLTVYDGSSGWVYLGETSMTAPTEEPVSPSPTASPRPVETTAPGTSAPETPSVSAEPENDEEKDPSAVIKSPFSGESQKSEDESPKHSSSLSNTTIIVSILGGLIIILAALIIFIVLRHK